MDRMEVTKEIFQVGGKGLTSPEDGAIYLICFDGSGALIDAGSGRSVELLLQNIRATGVSPGQIEYLLMTHCHFDHTGGARTLREKLQCEIIAHELDARFLEQGDDDVTAASWYGSSMEAFSVDRKLSGSQQEIFLGGREITAVHCPGHSPGSVVYVTESEGLRVLFGQDVHGPLHADLLSNREDYLHSLGRLLSLEADILCEGHFGVYKGKKAVEGFIKSYMM